MNAFSPLTGLDLDAADLAALEELAVSVAGEAATFVVDRRAAELDVRSKSSEVDIVTIMDGRSQELIETRLRQARPQDAFFGEEDVSVGGQRGDSGLTWVVDPIDGTVNYLYGYPQFAVSVALVAGDPATPGAWQPVVGAVADALGHCVHHARLGGGAWTRSADGVRTRLQVGSPQSLSTSLVATGFGYDAAKRVRQARALTEIIGRVRDIRRGGSAALDLCHVAAGRVDAYYEMGINPWDMAAGWLVVTEAGGVLTGAGGRAPSSRCVAACAPSLAAEFLPLVDSLVGIVDDDRA